MQLRRIIKSGRWIPEIDGLRFVAITSVICFHIMGQMLVRSGHTVAIQPRYDILHLMLVNGGHGVLLFFVISGFIMAQPFLRQRLQGGAKVKLGAYYLRRVTRLEPPYILSLILYTIGFLFYPGIPFLTMLPHLLASIFYVHNLVFGTISTINFVTWSLEIEIQFYFLAPLIGMLFAIRNKMARRCIFVLIMLVCGSVHFFVSGRGSMTIFNYGHYFIAGFLLADLMADRKVDTARYWIWDAVSIIGWPVLFLLPHEAPATTQWLPFLILPLYLSAFYGPLTNRVFRQTWIALAGGMCYSFYLMHMLVISIVAKASNHLIVCTCWLFQLSRRRQTT